MLGAGKVVIDIKPTFSLTQTLTQSLSIIIALTALIRDSVPVKNVGTVRGTVTLLPVDAITSQSSGSAFTDHSPQHDIGAWIRLSKHLYLSLANWKQKSKETDVDVHKKKDECCLLRPSRRTHRSSAMQRACTRGSTCASVAVVSTEAAHEKRQ